MKDTRYCSECQGNGCKRCNQTGEVEIEICSNCLCEYEYNTPWNEDDNDICLQCAED